MRLSFAKDRILAVMAHPDDAELVCGGTLARARAEGAAIAICAMCKGDKGKGAGSRDKGGEELSQRRRGEAAAAAKILGAEFFWFGCGDGELYDNYENRRQLLEIYRQYKPTLLIGHPQNDYHPDHRAAAALTEAASWFCASRGHVTASPALEAPPVLWLADTINMSAFDPDFYIDITGHIDVKQAMLNCHKSQLMRGKDGDFTPLMELMLRQVAVRGSQANVTAAEAFRAHHALKRAVAF